jgi:DNA-binding MarR family transcriptional regulator/GNAT superfamily N-acetyltransferase
MDEHRISAVRGFNRFYSGVIGALDESLLDTPFSLTEARVLSEIAEGPDTPLAAVRQRVGIDAGYLSRILRRFERDGLITRVRSQRDTRRHHLTLTEAGRAAFAELDARASAEVQAMLDRLTDGRQRQLLDAMRQVRTLLGPSRISPVVLREPRSGEYGWVVARHGELYRQEYGWDRSFEALVARIVADYLELDDPASARAWIAEVDGEPAGSVFCVPKQRGVAQLRLLLVEPRARGMGIGEHLVAVCIRFARDAGYRELRLWTNDVLVAARRLYQRAGFVLVEETPFHGFGRELTSQVWSLDLDPGDARQKARARARSLAG